MTPAEIAQDMWDASSFEQARNMPRFTGQHARVRPTNRLRAMQIVTDATSDGVSFADLRSAIDALEGHLNQGDQP